MNKCYFFDECYSEDATYCKLCGEWFCGNCRIRYKDRMVAMIKKKIPHWFSREEVDEMKKKGTWLDG